MEAHILNNLAFACWQHKLESKVPDETIDKDSSYIEQYFKDAIGLIERTQPNVDENKLSELLNDSCDQSVELTATGHDKTITNLSEYLL